MFRGKFPTKLSFLSYMLPYYSYKLHVFSWSQKYVADMRKGVFSLVECLSKIPSTLHNHLRY